MVDNGADVQIDRGNYTRIHNAILEQLAKTNLNGREFRCVMFLLRSTYGFNRKEAQISLTEWTNGTGIKRGHIAATLDELAARKIITKTEGDAKTKRATAWQFNKYFEQWLTSTPLGTGFSGATSTQGGANTSTQGGTVTGTQGGTNTSTPHQSTIRSIKDSIKDNSKDIEKQGERPEALDAPKMPQRRVKVEADGYTQEARALGLTPVQFVEQLNTWLDITGTRALVDAGDDNRLRYAKEDTLILARLGYADKETALELADLWRADNPYRTGKRPTWANLKDFASQRAAAMAEAANRPAQRYSYTNPFTGEKVQVTA